MESDPLVGETLGQYELQGIVARGRYTILYEALQPSLQRRVALRIQTQEMRANPHYVEAFMQVARLIAQLEHPHIIPVHDYGVERGYSYMALRLMMGGSLRTRIQQGELPLQEIVTILRQLASAMEYVHAQGKVTGEIGRGNVLFDLQGNPYLTDLFFAEIKFPAEVETIVRYMSPERCRDEAATALSDQYALGVLVYQMLTGHFPFIGTRSELFRQHLSEPVPPPQIHRASTPLTVNDVLFRALAKKPEDRYPTVTDFAREFEKAVAAVPQQVFISYSRRDRDYAVKLREHLMHNGFNVWIDSQIDYGDMWFKEIDDAIKTCAAFVLLMTPDSYQSEWVQKEILLAKRSRKQIFPLLLKGQEFGIVIDLQFADVRSGEMPDVNFHRRLSRAVFGDI